MWHWAGNTHNDNEDSLRERNSHVIVLNLSSHSSVVFAATEHGKIHINYTNKRMPSILINIYICLYVYVWNEVRNVYVTVEIWICSRLYGGRVVSDSMFGQDIICWCLIATYSFPSQITIQVSLGLFLFGFSPHILLAFYISMYISVLFP